MALETVFFNALEAADTFERKDPELVLRDHKGMELARFRQTKSI